MLRFTQHCGAYRATYTEFHCFESSRLDLDTLTPPAEDWEKLTQCARLSDALVVSGQDWLHHRDNSLESRFGVLAIINFIGFAVYVIFVPFLLAEGRQAQANVRTSLNFTDSLGDTAFMFHTMVPYKGRSTLISQTVSTIGGLEKHKSLPRTTRIAARPSEGGLGFI